MPLLAKKGEIEHTVFPKVVRIHIEEIFISHLIAKLNKVNISDFILAVRKTKHSKILIS